MATALDVSFNKEKSNYLRLCRAIIDLGTEILRKILDQSVPPNSILKEVTRLNIKLKTHQKQKIRTISGDYKELDISFLYYLITKLCTNIKPTRGWYPSYPPAPSEITLGDDVERIHFIRNYLYGHINEASVSDQIYKEYWEELEDLMDRMDISFGVNFKKSLLTIEIDSMDLETIKKGHLKELNQQKIERWNREEECFCETKASKKLASVVKEKTVTVITGPPGSGKSAIAHHIAIALQNEAFQIVPVESIEELERSWIQGSKQAFVLDDVFGVYKLDDVEIGNWYKRKERLQHCFENNKILVTMRKQYSCDKRLQALFSEFQYSIIDVTHKDLLLSEREKRAMFMKHMSVVKKRSNCKDIIKNCNFSFFPLLCRLFASDSESKYSLDLFFSNPLSVLKTEIELLRENKNVKYLGLVLCAIYDNKLSVNAFDIGEESKETKHTRKDFSECCGLPRSTSRQEIKSNLESLLGTYIFLDSGYYRFIHEIIYDVVVSTLSSQFQRSILKHCSSQFINQRIVLFSNNSKEDDIQPVITLDSSLKQDWLDRLVLDIERKNYFDVFLNTCLNDESIEEQFLNHLKGNCTFNKNYFLKTIHRSDIQLDMSPQAFQNLNRDALRKKLIDFQFYNLTNNYTLIHLIVANNLNKIFFYIYNMLSKSEKEEFWATNETLLYVAVLNGNNIVFQLCKDKLDNIDQSLILLLAVLVGNVELAQKVIGNTNITKDGVFSLFVIATELGYGKLIKIFIENDCDVNSNVDDNATFLHIASEKGHDSCVQILIDNGANIDKCDNNGLTALHRASKEGHDYTVQVLIDKGAIIDKCDNNGNTALHRASKEGHDSTVQILIDNGASVDKCDNYGITALHLSSMKGHDSTVQILIDNGASVDKCGKDGTTALHGGSQEGHDSTVQILIDKGAIVDKCDKDGETALHLASREGHDSIVQILIDNGASVDNCNNNSNTALHRASQEGHDNTVQILIDKGAIIDKCDNNGITALHVASLAGHDSTVQLLIDNGASVDKCGNYGTTALHRASLEGHDSTVQILIDKGASIDKCTNNGITALHVASLRGHDSTVQLLIDKGASVDKCDKDGITALHRASLAGHDSTVQILIDNGASVDKCGNNGETALHLASLRGHDSTVQLLIDKGASVDKCDKDGITALHSASQEGHDSTVQLLIDNGASVDKCDKDGTTVLHRASQARHDSTVQLLIDNGASVDKCGNNGETALHVASQEGHDSTVQLLIDKGASVDKCGNYGNTALHRASLAGHDSTVQLLIDNGASVDKCGNYGNTALHLASQKGHDSTVQILIDKGAIVDKCGNDGETALHVASLAGHDSTVQILIDNGASVDKCGNNGVTALHVASLAGHDSTVQILIDNGASVDKCGKDGTTALHGASQEGHDSTVQILIDNGASVDKCDKDGTTALHGASQEGHDSTVQILIDNGASVDKCGNDGETALHFASYKGHNNCVQILIDNGASADKCNNDGHTALHVAAHNGNERPKYS